MINSACNIAGPALGALAITTLAMPVVLMLDVIGAILACTSLAFVKIPNPPPSEYAGENNVLQDLKRGSTGGCQPPGNAIIVNPLDHSHIFYHASQRTFPFNDPQSLFGRCFPNESD